MRCIVVDLAARDEHWDVAGRAEASLGGCGRPLRPLHFLQGHPCTLYDLSLDDRTSGMRVLCVLFILATSPLHPL